MMEVKKYKKHQLERNSGLYFVIGLTLVLLASYVALEWKTFEHKLAFNDTALNELEFIDEIPPLTIHKLPPPPPKIQTPPVLDIINDEEDIVETVIESNDFDQDTEIIPLDEVKILEEPIADELPFSVIEDKPIFPGCENAADKYACFQTMMKEHIRSVFSYPEPAINMGLQGRVDVIFTIQKDGSIGNLRMRGPHAILEKEAERIISKLPQMTPGKQRGTPVKVPLSVPIHFVLR